jgi:hypothetical protein
MRRMPCVGASHHHRRIIPSSRAPPDTCGAANPKERTMVNPFAGTVRAPEFPAGLEWFNSAPLRMQDLRGKLVILDFWTYC